jgi:hypothetical protein
VFWIQRKAERFGDVCLSSGVIEYAKTLTRSTLDGEKLAYTIVSSGQGL